MTEKQEIRAKSAELAVRLISSARPFKPIPKELTEEELNVLFDCIKLFTDKIEAVISPPSC